MALAPFQWSGNQAITSPEQAARKRAIAEALMAQSATPAQNWGQGLADVAAALSGTVLEGRVSEAEAAGRERAGSLFADLAINSDPNAIMAALTSPDSAWASPAQTSIASALLNQGLERSDPMYQLQLQTAQAELDALRNPAPTNPFLNVGNGSVFNQSTGEFMTAPQGSGAQPADVQEYNFYAEQAAANGQQPLPYLDYLQAQKGNGLSITTADGTVIQQGGGKPLTEGQSKDTVYFTRASAALPIVDELEQSLLSLGEAAAGTVPAGLGNYLQSEDYQVAQNAGKEFLASILRKDTGAAVTPSEEKLYGDIFLPRPGDKPATIARKRQARAVALAAIEAGMPPQAIQNAARALEKTGTGPAPDMGGMPTAPASVQPTDGVVDWTDYFNGN